MLNPPLFTTTFKVLAALMTIGAAAVPFLPVMAGRV
jgi:hypothetical protein